MLRTSLLLTLLAGCLNAAWAAEPAPAMLGNLKATEHQLCGKSIEIQSAAMKGKNAGRTIIALKNNKSGELDLFASTTENAANKQYDKYLPVKFDSLSRTFIEDSTGRPDIVWGGAINNLKGMEYSLALGSHVYACDGLQPFKGEVANDLYGEEAK